MTDVDYNFRFFEILTKSERAYSLRFSYLKLSNANFLVGADTMNFPLPVFTIHCFTFIKDTKHLLMFHHHSVYNLLDLR